MEEAAMPLSVPGLPVSLSFRSGLAVFNASNPSALNDAGAGHPKRASNPGQFAGALVKPVCRREMRKLINEAHGRFVELQRQALGHLPVGEGPASPVESIRACSRHYRALLTACVTNLSAALAQEGDDGALGRVVDLMQEAQSVLHLAEVLYIAGAGTSDFPVVPELLRWLCLRPSEDDVCVPAELAREARPEAHDKYWHYVCRCVALGRMADAMELLRAHSQARAAAEGDGDAERDALGDEAARCIEYVVELLGGMPVPEGARHAGEFYSVWHRWQTQCREAVAEGSLGAELEGVLRVACGEGEALAAACGPWYELLVARLLYRAPAARAHDLRAEAVDECVAEAAAAGVPPSPLDGALRLLFALEPDSAVLELRAVAGEAFAWLPAHAADLLHHAAAFDPANLAEEGGLREACLLEYAESLAATPALARLAADYLSYCPRSAARFLPHVLERVPWGTDRQALKLLAACNRQPQSAPGFPSLLCRAVGAQRLREGRLVAAAWWLLRALVDFDAAAAAAGHSPAPAHALLEGLAARALARALDSGSLEEVRAVAALAAPVPPEAFRGGPAAPALAFLAAFAAARAAADAGDGPAAAPHLAALLRSEGAAAAALYGAPSAHPREAPRAARLAALAALARPLEEALRGPGGPGAAGALAVALQDLAMAPAGKAGGTGLGEAALAGARGALLDGLARAFVDGE